MTDPERISKRSTGLSAQLLRAGADEQPGEAGVERTLVALGISGAVLTSAGATSAAAGGVKVASALSGGAGAGVGSANVMGAAASGTAKAVSALVLAKWIGIGVVSGVGLAGAAALATGPAVVRPAPVKAVISAPQVAAAAVVVATPQSAKPSAVEAAPLPEAAPSVVTPAPHVSVAEPAYAAPGLEVGAPLAAEVAFVDNARALLAAGRTEQGLSMLQGYEREFPAARLLPEVLFLRMETCDRLGRAAEARAAAQRLLGSFPKSPHASRARKLLDR